MLCWACSLLCFGGTRWVQGSARGACPGLRAAEGACPGLRAAGEPRAALSAPGPAPAPPRRAGNAPFGRRFPPGARRAGPEAEARAAGPGRAARRWRRRGRAARRAPWPPAPASTSRTPPSTCGTSSSWTGREVSSGERQAAGPGRAGPGLWPGRGSPSAVAPPLVSGRAGARPAPLRFGAPGSALRPAQGSGSRSAVPRFPQSPGPAARSGAESGAEEPPAPEPRLKRGVVGAGQSESGPAPELAAAAVSGLHSAERCCCWELNSTELRDTSVPPCQEFLSVSQASRWAEWKGLSGRPEIRAAFTLGINFSLSLFVWEMGSQMSLLKQLRVFFMCFELFYFSAQSSAGSLLPVSVSAEGSGVSWIVFPVSWSLGSLSPPF